ncbi:uncharacterized protein SCODWIG_02391 [Saccharomycodes ludwigii]|uniref:Uncharacterized protein n=2 Tax=Saccharomycodes ludwigii TaxID=36035 RepID=A0A376B925_9ASCO|nr:uncharacterized protein SCODWIG_02391 [Saccharomycodes ludwigii]
MVSKDNSRNELKLNENILGFCYNLFEPDLFIKAISILESNNLFIYILNLDNKNDEEINKSLTLCNVNKEKVMFRIIIKEDSDDCNQNDSDGNLKNKKNTSIVFTDLPNWYCSCNEFNGKFQQKLNTVNLKKDLVVIYNHHKDRLNEHGKDYFGKFQYSSHKDKYTSGLLMCPHLLASAMLLQNSDEKIGDSLLEENRVLRYFTKIKQSCYIIQVTNIDEWLRLQCNIIV